MQNKTMQHKTIWGAALFALACSACTSTPLRIETPPVAANEEVIGPVEGKSGGFMLFQVFPIGQNGRFENAYANALEKSGATRLVDVTMQEKWFWALVGNGYVFKVSGTGVRPRRGS